MATEELIYCEEQAKKWIEWDQVSLTSKTVKRGFAADEPHPSDDTFVMAPMEQQQDQVIPTMG